MSHASEVPASRRSPRVSAVLKSDERVTPLELFFDLVFVLALTQCTALMADLPTWEGLARGLLVLGVMWWAWTGYAWLTSVVDPEEGIVRIAFFVSMAGLLVVSLCIPEAFGDNAVLFACGYAVVRGMHIALFRVACRDDPDLARSVAGLAVSSAVGVGILFGASFADGTLQGALWALALLLDLGGPFFFGAEGWKVIPGHFAERLGLIIIIALGESIVAIGVGAEGIDVTAGVVVAAVFGITIAACQWWLYFDVTAKAAERRFAAIEDRGERNKTARDAYSYMHLVLAAGIVLIALGLKKTIGDVDEPLKRETTVALLGGAGLFLLALVGIRLRIVRSLSPRRLIVGVALIVLGPIVYELKIDAVFTVGGLAVVLVGLVTYEAVRYAADRDRIRHEGHHGPEPAS